MELFNCKPENKKTHLEKNFLYFFKKQLSSNFGMTADQVIKKIILCTPG